MREEQVAAEIAEGMNFAYHKGVETALLAVLFSNNDDRTRDAVLTVARNLGVAGALEERISGGEPTD